MDLRHDLGLHGLRYTFFVMQWLFPMHYASLYRGVTQTFKSNKKRAFVERHIGKTLFLRVDRTCDTARAVGLAWYPQPLENVLEPD